MEVDFARPFPGARRPSVLFGVLAAIGWAGVALGLALDPSRAWFAYLAAYVYVLTTVLGALCLVMIAHTTNARWFVLVRRLAESVCGAVPALVLLFIPLLFALPQLYPWAAPAAPLGDRARELVERKRAYLNVPFFIVRAGVYLTTWWVLAAVLRRWSLRQDRADGSASPRWIAGVSGAGLMLFGFTLTFAAFDWVMSLAPTWQSSVFGIYVFCGSMTAGLGALLVLTYILEHSRAPGTVHPAHYHALGRLLLTFVALWAYIAYSQGMLIWIANIPDEVHFYTLRIAGGWGVLLIVLAVGHFLLPFLLLLSRSIKRNGAAMAAIGVWMLVMHYLDVFWLVIPALHGPGTFHWLDAPALLAIGASATVAALWSAVGHPLVPVSDPRLPAGLEYRSP